MERHLRGLAHWSAEDEQRGHGQVRYEVGLEGGFRGGGGDRGSELGKIDLPGDCPEHEDARHEAEIANAVDEDRLVRGGGGLGPGVPVALQGVDATAAAWGRSYQWPIRR